MAAATTYDIQPGVLPILDSVEFYNQFTRMDFHHQSVGKEIAVTMDIRNLLRV